MKRVIAHLLGGAVIAALSAPVAAADYKTVKGEVVDLECAMSKGAAGRGDGHGACAMTCARKGDQVAILADDAVYLVAGDYTANNNAKLLDFVAKRVEAKGDVVEKDGKLYITVASMGVLR